VYKNNIDANIFIEGHFHQGRFYEDRELQKLYLNLPSFGVEQSYMVVQKKELLLVCHI
jgi:UDP-2,3-diacylglucosamine pyrophosphatase LpxH